MPYDDVVKCPCGKSWVPKGFERQCPHCKGKKPLPDLWAEMCNAKPSWPVDLTTPTNSRPVAVPFTPKKEVIRINLPPKPFSGEPVGSKSVNVAADFKLDKNAWDEPSLNDVYEELTGEATSKVSPTFQKEMEEVFGAMFGDFVPKKKRTLVVNLFAGPGAGKSTTAAGIFFQLKTLGINCELASEFAKDLVWEERHQTIQDQIYIFGKQYHRIFRLMGRVDVIIVDSPLLLTPVYDGERRKTLRDLAVSEHCKMWTYNVFLKRKKDYKQAGRVHDEAGAGKLDGVILDLLDDIGECYEVFDGNLTGTNAIVKKITALLEYNKII